MARHNQSALTGSQGKAPSTLYLPPSTSPPSIDAVRTLPMTCLSSTPVSNTPALPLKRPQPAVSSPPPPVMFSPPPTSPLPLLPVAGPPLSLVPLSPMPPILSSSPLPACAFGRRWLVGGWHSIVMFWKVRAANRKIFC